MRSPSFALALPRTPLPARSVMEARAQRREQIHEVIAGICITIGLCWPFVFSSILPVRWWMFLPFALLGGMLRQRVVPRPWKELLPLLAFFLVVVVFGILGMTVMPMNEYGAEKFKRFLLLAIAVFVVASRQAPLTKEFMRGIRGTLLVTLLLGTVITILKRDLFLEAGANLEDLRSSFSTTGFPLAISLAAMGLLPPSIAPKQLLTSALALLASVVLIVFVRGRFDAGLVLLLLGMLVLGPPWRHIFWRVIATGVLVVVGMMVYVNVLPLLGDSFLYLTWLNPESMGGRMPLFQEAFHGFLAYPLGHGIGSFQLIEPYMSYPHNLVLEVAYEMGIFGVVAILGIYWFVLRRVGQLWSSPPHRVLAGMLILVFCHILKAGDLAMWAFQWLFLYTLVVATPLAPSWALVRKR